MIGIKVKAISKVHNLFWEQFKDFTRTINVLNTDFFQ